MKTKYGKHYADWRDEHGKRHAKAFPTKKAALRWQRRMQLATAGKKAQASARLKQSAMRGPTPTRRGRTNAGQRRNLHRSRGTSSRTS